MDKPKRHYTFEALAAMIGFGLIIAVVFPFAVEPFVEWVPGRKKYFIIMCVGAGLMVGANSFAIAWFFLIRRISHIATTLNETCIKDGDLTFRLPILSRDTFGDVGDKFNENIAAMHDMVGSVKLALNLTRDIVKSLDGNVARTDGVVTEYDRNLELMLEKVSILESSVSEVMANMENLAASSQQTASGILEQQANIREIDVKSDNLAASIHEIASALQELRASMASVTDNAESMSTSANFTMELISRMEEVVNEIRSIVQKETEYSSQMVKEAGRVIKQSTEMASSMKEIEGKSGQLSEIFDELYQNSESIGQIITVMEEIGDQTGLLALNASIIAAQAGNEGRSFAVVASEIRDLSDKTSASARDVGQILDKTRSGIRKAHDSLQESRQSISRGVTMTIDAGEALDNISRMITHSQESISAIDSRVMEQAANYAEVLGAMKNVADQAVLVSNSSGEQQTGLDQIGSTASDILGIATSVKEALGEQRDVSSQISDATERVTRLVSDVEKISHSHSATVDEVRAVLNALNILLETSRQVASDLTNDRGMTQNSMEDLITTMDRFDV
jgi:methyl-accepting chemotaxis protein